MNVQVRSRRMAGQVFHEQVHLSPVQLLPSILSHPNFSGLTCVKLLQFPIPHTIFAEPQGYHFVLPGPSCLKRQLPGCSDPIVEK